MTIKIGTVVKVMGLPYQENPELDVWIVNAKVSFNGKVYHMPLPFVNLNDAHELKRQDWVPLL